MALYHSNNLFNMYCCINIKFVNFPITGILNEPFFLEEKNWTMYKHLSLSLSLFWNLQYLKGFCLWNLVVLTHPLTVEQTNELNHGSYLV